MSGTAKLSELVRCASSMYQNVSDKFTGPNEVSIRDKAAIQPMMGTQGFAKGPGT